MTHPASTTATNDHREPIMSDTSEMQALPATELTIVPDPQRNGWAIVNRLGDVIAFGGYGECLRRMGRIAPATR
jgi:hypothetical protein